MALGKLVKLFGNVAYETLAIAEAFKMANGFLPVKLVWPLLLFFPFMVVDVSFMLLIDPADLAPAP